MFVGARVAYVIGGKARLGVITSLGEERHSIQLDNGNIVAVNPDRLRLANYWRDRNREKEVDNLRTYPPDTGALEIFKSKGSVVFGVAAMRSMWYWTNQYIFNKKLRLPKLRVNANRQQQGSYRFLGRGKPGLISASVRNHNLYELFDTILHECVHQYNHEIEWLEEGEFEPQYEGVHGHAFLKWIPIIQSKTGVKITVTADTTEDATQFDENVQDEQTTKPFIFALIKMGKGWIGFIVKDKTDLTILTAEASSYLMAIRSSDENVYAGISTLRRVKNEFQPVRGGHVNFRSVKSYPSTAVVKLAATTGKEIDGWRLPNLSKFE